MKVKLRNIKQNDIEIIKSWLTDKDNAKWLDTFFQNEKLRDEQLALFLMRKDKEVYMILYEGIPVGIMGLMNINIINRSAEIMSLLGDKNYRRKGIISIAHFITLKKAFYELHLHSVNAWVADANFTTIVCEKLNFSRIGTQRECHMMDGILKDRILYDILKKDFDELSKTYNPEYI